MLKRFRQIVFDRRTCFHALSALARSLLEANLLTKRYAPVCQALPCRTSLMRQRCDTVSMYSQFDMNCKDRKQVLLRQQRQAQESEQRQDVILKIYS